MFIKYVLFVIVAVACIQVAATVSVTREKRDAPTVEEATKALGDLFAKLKSGAHTVSEKITDSDIYKDLKEALAKLGESVQNKMDSLKSKAT